MRNRQAARGHHQGRGGDRALVGAQGVVAWSVALAGAGVVLHRFDGAARPARDAAGIALGQQHANKVFCRVVAKQLAFVLFMKSNAVLLYQVNKVLWRVARQGRAAKVRVLADEVLVRRRGVKQAVGEIATPAARDADLFGHFQAVVDDQHLQPGLTGHARAKQARSACAHNHDIKGIHGLRV